MSLIPGESFCTVSKNGRGCHTVRTRIHVCTRENFNPFLGKVAHFSNKTLNLWPFHLKVPFVHAVQWSVSEGTVKNFPSPSVIDSKIYSRDWSLFPQSSKLPVCILCVMPYILYFKCQQMGIKLIAKHTFPECRAQLILIKGTCLCDLHQNHDMSIRNTQNLLVSPSFSTKGHH